MALDPDDVRVLLELAALTEDQTPEERAAVARVAAWLAS